MIGPSPEHGNLIVDLGIGLRPKAHATGHRIAAPVNIGVDKYDAKVPDMGIYLPDTERHSPAFLTTAEFVVETLSPGERAGEKLPFYASVGVQEYLEVDLAARTCRLLANQDGGWQTVERSVVIELDIAEVTALL